MIGTEIKQQQRDRHSLDTKACVSPFYLDLSAFKTDTLSTRSVITRPGYLLHSILYIVRLSCVCFYVYVSSHQTSTHPFVQTVCILCAVRQPLCEHVAAGVTQCCMFPALQTSLSQQNGPDLTHRLTPLLLPGEKQTL